MSSDNRPILLDLFCGAGGAGMGYHQAGFRVIGVDCEPMPNYPFEFYRGDALFVASFVASRGRLPESMGGHVIEAVHASPPCQRYSAMSKCRPEIAEKYPDLVPGTRRHLTRGGLPWVIENVPGAPLRNDLELCGTQFGLELYRHRIFEMNFPVSPLAHRPHQVPASKAGHWTPGTIMSVSGHIAPIAHARKIMGINWTNRDELAESIPPAYTKYIGAQLMKRLEAR